MRAYSSLESEAGEIEANHSVAEVVANNSRPCARRRAWIPIRQRATGTLLAYLRLE